MSSFKVTEIARMTGLNHLLESSVMAAYLMLLACGLMYLNHRVFSFQATEKVYEKSLHYSNMARRLKKSKIIRKNFLHRFQTAACCKRQLIVQICTDPLRIEWQFFLHQPGTAPTGRSSKSVSTLRRFEAHQL